MAKTPHSSWNLSRWAGDPPALPSRAPLSNIVLEGLFPAVFESADTAVDQRLPPVCDYDSVFHRETYMQSLHRVLRGDLDDLLHSCCRQQHPRRPFVKQQQLRAQVGIEIDVGADA